MIIGKGFQLCQARQIQGWSMRRSILYKRRSGRQSEHSSSGDWQL